MSDLKCEVSEYKGNKVLNIMNGEKRVMSFGIKKAKAILSQVESIEKFVEENSVDKGEDTKQSES